MIEALNNSSTLAEPSGQARRRYSKNAYLRGEKLVTRNRRIFAAHKASKNVSVIARKFELSQTTIRKVLEKMLDEEFEQVTAPQLIEDHIAAATAADIPLSALIGKRRYYDWHWAAQCLGGDPPIGKVKAHYEDFTREQLERYIYDFDDHIAAIERCLGPVTFMSLEQFDDRALARIDFHRSQGRWDEVRYIDWDPRPESFFADTLPSRRYSLHGGYQRRTNTCFNPEMTLETVASRIRADLYGTSIYYDDQERAEREYVALERLTQLHGGPDEITQFVERGREKWRNRHMENERKRTQKLVETHEKAVDWAKFDTSSCRSWVLFVAGITVLPTLLAAYEARMLLRPDISIIAHHKHIPIDNYQISFLYGVVGVALGVWFVSRGLIDWWRARQKLKRAKAALAEVNNRDNGHVL